MTGAPAAKRTARRSERDLLESVARWLQAKGYRTYLDPDGTSYFDLIARRGEEVGLVEGKVGRTADVLRQALRRRAWGAWVAIAVDAPRAAARLLERTDGARASAVGVWTVSGDAVHELRPPRHRPRDDEADPFAPCRARLLAVLDQIDRGELPVGVRWSGVVREVRRASGGRGFAEWRLDEPVL